MILFSAVELKNYNQYLKGKGLKTDDAFDLSLFESNIDFSFNALEDLARLYISHSNFKDIALNFKGDSGQTSTSSDGLICRAMELLFIKCCCIYFLPVSAEKGE